MRLSPLRSVPRVDLLIGFAIIALGTLEAFTVGPAYGEPRPELWWVGQALVTGVLVWYRRRAPVAVFILMILAQYVWHRQGHPGCPVWQLAALLIVFHTIGAHLPVKHGGSWALAGILIFDSGAVDHRFLPFDEVIYLTVMFGSAYATGLALRGYLLRAHRMSERAARLEVERERRAAEAVAAERNRIARELHDVVAHSVSMMVMQAGVLRRRMGAAQEDGPSSEAEMLSGIEQAGREAVEELRIMLGALRMPQDEALPQPGLDMVPNLISTVGSSGLRVTLETEGEPVRLAPGLDLSAYRIVQEALTNAVKYAGDADARIRIAYLPDRLELEITDNGGGAGPALSTGNGLIGMRERAELFGGSLDAGPLPQGGYRVRATLPISQGVPMSEATN
ncbi:sensor histidine kinase [Microbispora sp. NBRC 16548]|uniref:sensor histidine kinase n=1 Tax=Microbispora sp. NBRC 16548 TaxID=3030994 RepID=UPI0024A199D6|nr:sensor histidine kinase [Microbispora sp. NBRC 16548]GLX06128.1 two-component sensor histidine kinase [Microbispora sp. NBRC 16548]